MLTDAGLLGRGFVFREIVREGPRHMLPPREMWPAMLPTLALANELRARMVALGARGLLIAAAYRPEGGEADSRHKHNAALDLDLLPEDMDAANAEQPPRLRGNRNRLTHSFACEAALLWRECEDLKVGLGTYAPDRALYTRRVHIDTGWRHRCWQGTGVHYGRQTWAARPAALILAPHDTSDPESLELRAGGEQMGAVS